jgi:hypothetical protein
MLSVSGFVCPGARILLYPYSSHESVASASGIDARRLGGCDRKVERKGRFHALFVGFRDVKRCLRVT